MRIASSNISMLSNHTYIAKHEKSEYLRSWIGNRTSNFSEKPSINSLRNIKDNIPKASLSSKQSTSTEDMEDPYCNLNSKERLALKIAEIFLEKLTGKKQKIKLARIDKKLPQENTSKIQNLPSQGVGWGLEYEKNEMNFEHESVSFQAKGIVNTKDGQSIDISLKLNMSRQYIEKNDINLKMGDAQKLVDPLVVNFDGNAAQLTQDKYNFDLNSDGKMDQISFTGSLSGFLALDKNSNGIIDNGTELFGPTTGDGFSELVQYDTDGDMWLDEDDDIYNNLLIWTKNAAGQDELFSLKEKNIGAIYLANTSTPFDFKDNNNELQGTMKSSSIFLGENGGAGTVQQIDLSV